MSRLNIISHRAGSHSMERFLTTFASSSHPNLMSNSIGPFKLILIVLYLDIRHPTTTSMSRKHNDWDPRLAIFPIYKYPFNIWVKDAIHTFCKNLTLKHSHATNLKGFPYHPQYESPSF